MGTVTKLSLQRFPYDLIVALPPHSDDFGLFAGGMAAKLRRLRTEVRVVVVTTMPGFNGVSDEWLCDHSTEARASLHAMVGLSRKADLGDHELLAHFRRMALGLQLDAYGRTAEERLRNVLATAVRWDEGRREAMELGLPPASYRFLGLARSYAERRPVPDDIQQVRTALEEAARGSKRRLLLTPHPEDKHASHRLSTEISIRASGTLDWDVAHVQTPWSDLPKVSLIVPLTQSQLGAKLDAVQRHFSQTHRTDYCDLAESTARKNAIGLAEQIAGFGSNSNSVGLGKYCEVFQLREFCARHLATNGITIVDTQPAWENDTSLEDIPLFAEPTAADRRAHRPSSNGSHSLSLSRKKAR